MGYLTGDFGEKGKILEVILCFIQPLTRSELSRKSSINFHPVPPPSSAVQGGEEWSVIQGVWRKCASQEGD